MAKQTFTSGQVLTAAQMTSLQQTAMLGGDASAKVASYVLTAADAGTTISMSNGSATTITVNTGLFAAGDIVTIINLGAGVCTITAGTATVTTSGSLALAQNQGGVLRFTSASAAIFFQFATPASGDIEGVTAGTGISGGGTSGTVTITNSMATTIDAKGDLIVGTGNDTFSRLAVGTNGYTIVADSAESTGLKWQAPASGGGMTLLSTTSIGAVTSVTVSITGTGYESLRIVISDFTLSSAGNQIYVRFNSDTANNYFKSGTLTGFAQSDQAIGSAGAQSSIYTSQQARTTQTDSIMILDILNSEQSTCHKVGHYVYKYFRINDEAGCETGGFCYASNSAISSMTLGMLTSGTFSAGEIKVYGVK